MTEGPLLAVEGMRVRFRTDEGVVRAVDGVSFELHPGEVLAIVGESGCGKSVTAMSLLGLTSGPEAAIEGRATLAGTELLTASPERLRRLRGEEVAIVFQDPAGALNPVHRIGAQIVEQIRAHRQVSRRVAWRRAVELLGEVGLSDPRAAARSYPHQLSGGMLQRAMIAMALSLEPGLLIADEPTTALDVTVQAQILGLLAHLNRTRGLAVVLISHDLGVVAALANRVLVMYAGQIVESGSAEQIFYDPRHPYTWGLLGSIPRFDRPPGSRLAQIPGQPPSLSDPPAGCRFAPRCPHAFDRCREPPGLRARSAAEGHADRCWLSAERKRTARLDPAGGIGLGAR